MSAVLLAEMSGGLIAVIVAAGLLVLLVLFLVSAYNTLVVLRTQYTDAYAQIDVQLRRRCALSPNPLQTVKGAMAHERETLEAVSAARDSADTAGQRAAANPGEPQAMNDLNRAEAQLTGSLGRLL